MDALIVEIGADDHLAKIVKCHVGNFMFRGCNGFLNQISIMSPCGFRGWCGGLGCLLFPVKMDPFIASLVG